jgi:hypothetical protein
MTGVPYPVRFIAVAQAEELRSGIRCGATRRDGRQERDAAPSRGRGVRDVRPRVRRVC